MSSPKLSVLIVNFNAGERLFKCLECLEAQTFRDFDIWIFDNASTDQSIEMAKNKTGLKLHIIHSEENIGFAAGNNRLSQQAGGEWLALLNPDAYAEPEWLASLIEASHKYPWADAFGSTQINALDHNKLDGVGDVYHATGITYRGGFGHPVENIPADGECFSPCAAAALYRRKVFQELGGFDERFFCYGEDVDLGFRLRLAGGRCVQVRRAVVYHEGSGVSGRHSEFTIYHGHRNRIWSWFLNMPIALSVLLFPLNLLTNFLFLLRAIITGSGKPYWRALCDGYKEMGAMIKSGKERRKNRRIKIVELVHLLTWSPVKVLRRAGDLKPLETPAKSQQSD